ncbi:MAG: porin [Nitrospirota bacterium]|nr:porin [Nitrospirota bacterium]
MAAAFTCLDCLVGLSFAKDADERSPPDHGWQYGAYLDVGYGLNFNFPDDHQWRSKQTTPRTNEIAPNMGLAYLRKEPRMDSRWGMELAVQGGYDTKELVPREHAMSGADTLRHLARANVSYLAPVGNGLELTAGLMKGFINYESFYAKDNFNYTRTYLTDYNPNFIFAVGGRYPITPNVDLGLHILNGFQYLSHPNNLPSYGAELDWRLTTHTTLYQNLYYGPDQTDTNLKFWRAFTDSTLQWRGESLTLALSYDIGTEKSSADPGNPRQFWMASALYTRWEMGGPWAVALRPEMFWGPERFADPRATITLGHDLDARLQTTCRPTARHRASRISVRPFNWSGRRIFQGWGPRTRCASTSQRSARHLAGADVGV